MSMHQKGASSIDFAMALSVTVVVIAFSMFYITNYFSRASPNDRTSELRSSAAGMEKILFGAAGIPQNWENNNYAPVRAGLRTDLKRIAITAAEKVGVNHSFEEIDLHVVFDRNCFNATYNNSIRIYDRFMNETPFRIYNYTECAANSGFLREANINFLFNITGNASTVFWLYYTNDTTTPKKIIYNFSYDSSLVGYWKLDAVNASNYTLDSTINHNDGKLKSYAQCGSGASACNLTAGKIGNALNFDGVDDYVNTSYTIPTGSDYSISVWSKWRPQTAGGGSSMRPLVMQGDTGTPNAVAIFTGSSDSGASYGLAFYRSGITPDINISGFNDTNWHYLSLVRIGSLFYAYYDGIFVGSNTAINHDTSTPIQIGGSSTVSGRKFNGTIDDVRIWNRSLSAEEIKAHYNYTSPKYISSSGSVPIITHKKISALQNLSYADVKSSLDLKGNFNITACEYSFGRHVPDTVNVMASVYPIIVINSSGSVKPCLASVNVW